MHAPLIAVAELADRLAATTVLDVRYRLGAPSGGEEYAAGHVPRAAYVDLDSALAGPPGPGGRHPLPDPKVFVAAMRAAGVSNRRPVVVYDAWLGHAAARAWWLLRHYGHRDVRVLDGGWPAWEAGGGAVEQGTPPRPPGDFAGQPGAMPVLTAADLPSLQVLIDARAPERFRGDVEPVDPVAGRIPGAVNVPSIANVDETGALLTSEALGDLYAGVGVQPGARVGVYCGSGVTAALDVLALEVVGISAALYAGSWSEWITDPTRPVARG